MKGDASVMFLRKNKGYKGRVYLTIAKGFRENGKSKYRNVMNIGYLDDFLDKYDDPLQHFKNIALEMTLQEKIQNQEWRITLDASQTLVTGTDTKKNYGYSAFSKIYHELEIDRFLINTFRHTNISGNKTNNIMKLLVFSRLLFPGSKLSAYENKEVFFENTNYSLKEMYNALTYLEPLKNKLQQTIYDHIKVQYNPKAECVYYDVTNYYFEIDEPDELRKKGVSKEHRPNPIVQMGLLMDSLGFPICYKLYPGNTNDCQTLLPVLYDVKKNYDLGKIIVVADKGLNTSSNIAYNVIKGNGYVYSQSIRGANAELKAFVLKQDGYTSIGEEYKCKSRLYPRELYIETTGGKKKKIPVDEKQVIFYSEKYAKKARAERQPAIDKAKELIGNPVKFNKANSYGAAKYVIHLVFDKNTGEIIEAKSILSLNEQKLKEEEQFDGYYAIVTSEYEKTDSEIIDIYRGLWKIEESFKITKSTLSARPVYLSRRDHIESHFLICYIALVLGRLLQARLSNAYSVDAIAKSLGNCCCYHIKENLYLFSYYDEILQALQNTLSIPYSLKYMRISEIKKNISDTKK